MLNANLTHKKPVNKLISRIAMAAIQRIIYDEIFDSKHILSFHSEKSMRQCVFTGK